MDRDEIASDVNVLKDLLCQHEIIKDVSGFQRTIGSLKNPHTKKLGYWQYDLEVDFFNIKASYMGAMLPRVELNNEDKPCDISLALVVCIKELEMTIGVIEDSIEELSVVFKIDLEGYIDGTDDVIVARSGWHLDKDLFNHATAKEGEDQTYYHPLFHMHFGGFYLVDDAEGKKLDLVSSVKKSSIAVFEAPRLIHPPLDGILAVDFVLRNFYSNTEQINELLNDIEYIQVIENARKRLWKPYFMGLAANWHKFQGVNIDPLYSKKLLDNSIYYINQE